MAVCAANMRKCDEKKRCQFGPNKGKAYSAKDPCCGQGKFDSTICDCIPPFPAGAVQVRGVEGTLVMNMIGPNCPTGTTEWRDVLPAPNYRLLSPGTPEEKIVLVTYTTHLYASLCRTDLYDINPCPASEEQDSSNPFPQLIEFLYVKKCIAGGFVVAEWRTSEYHDSEYQYTYKNFGGPDVYMTCINDAQGYGSYCNSYEVGDYGYRRFEYRQSDGFGGWEPLLFLPDLPEQILQ